MIGIEWKAPRGLRKVEAFDDARQLYLVREGSNPFCDLLTAADIESERDRDAKRLAYAQAREAEKQASEAQERERKAKCPLERFLSTLPAMKAGRARKSLDLYMRVNSGRADTRARHLLALYAKGYRTRGDKLKCEGERGYYCKRDFTGFGLEFLAFLETQEVQS